MDANCTETGIEYYDIVMREFGIDEQRHCVKYHTNIMDKRFSLVNKYSWAIPTREVLEYIVSVSDGRIVEIGAGTGYWAYEMKNVGCRSVLAYDDRSWDCQQRWTYVVRSGADAAAIAHDRTLFLCWPPYGTQMAYDALSMYLGAKGHTLVYVGELRGGCCADDRFFDIIDEQLCDCTEDGIDVPKWFGVNDVLRVYKKK